MLRATLGDSAFFRGPHRYYDRYRNGNALSDDLRRELEAASGMPLGWFFDQWLRRPGFPELTTSWTYDAVEKRVVVSITQDTRFGSYRFPLTIDIDRKSTRLNSSHQCISYAVLCLTKKNAHGLRMINKRN